MAKAFKDTVIAITPSSILPTMLTPTSTDPAEWGNTSPLPVVTQGHIRGSVTADTPLVTSQTWNNAAVAFNGASLDITDSASSAASLISRWRVNGTTVASITKTGQILASSASSALPPVSFVADTDTGLNGTGNQLHFVVGGGRAAGLSSVTFEINGYLGLTNGASAGGGGSDVKLYRDAAAVLNLRNGTNAQTVRVSGTYTSTTSYEWLRLSMDPTNGAIIGTEKGSAGGSVRPLLIQIDGTTRATVTAAGIRSKFITDVNAVAETIIPTHTLTLYDATGTAYKIPAVTA